MKNVTDRVRNPFGMSPPCEQFVPGYGDANADFHVIGDRPGVHGGVETGVPFTGSVAGERLQAVLADVGLVVESGDAPEVKNLFLSYLHTCVAEEPTAADYADMERFFDAELRAITAHVLLPVGERATEHVVEHYTAQRGKVEVDMARLHATELRGSGWLVIPVREPTEWEAGDAERLEEALSALMATDYRRESDLGRFLGDGESYLVR